MSELRDDLEPLDPGGADEIEDENEEISEGEDGALGHEENDDDIDGGGEPGEDQELGQPGEGQAKRQDVRPSRARGRAERLSRQLAEERTQRTADQARFQTQLDEVRRQLANQNSVVDQQRELERVALMSPEERIAYEVGKVRNEVRAELQRTGFVNQTASDAMQFRSSAASDPLARRYEAKVDAMARDLEARGQFVPRDMILSKLVGDDVRAKAARDRAKQARNGRARVARETTRPANGRADTGTPSRNATGYQAVLDRLKNATF